MGCGFGHGQGDQRVSGAFQRHLRRQADGFDRGSPGSSRTRAEGQMIGANAWGGVQPKSFSKDLAGPCPCGEHLEITGPARESRGRQLLGLKPAPGHRRARQVLKQVQSGSGAHHSHVSHRMDGWQRTHQQFGTNAAGISQADGEAQAAIPGNPR